MCHSNVGPLFSRDGIPKVLERLFLADVLVWDHESRHEMSRLLVAITAALLGQDDFVQMSRNEDSGSTYDLIEYKSYKSIAHFAPPTANFST